MTTTRPGLILILGLLVVPLAADTQPPTTFERITNLRTAKALGLTIPPSVLQQVTEVIQ